MDQHLYYEDSTVLKRLSYYPLVQIVVMLVFIAVVYFAVLSTKKPSRIRCGWAYPKRPPTNWARPFHL